MAALFAGMLAQFRHWMAIKMIMIRMVKMTDDADPGNDDDHETDVDDHDDEDEDDDAACIFA